MSITPLFRLAFRPFFLGACLLLLAQRLQDRGVQRFAVQRVRTASMLDTQLPSAPAQAALPELWGRLRELFPAFVLRG